MAQAVNGAAALATQGLLREYRDRILGPFDLSVEVGEVVVLVGPNGSGKTTFIRMCLGIDRASHGTSTILGRNVDPTRPPQSVGYVPDRAEFWNWLDARQNLEPFSKESDAIGDVLEQVDLTATTTPVRTFSRGMKQRLAIARALIGSPALLVMDEPTIALDEAAVAWLKELIARQRSAGKTVVVASHDDSFVRDLDARVVRFAEGRMIE